MQVIVRNQGLIHFQGKCILGVFAKTSNLLFGLATPPLIAIETKYGVDDASCICTFPSHENLVNWLSFPTQIEY